MTKFYEELVIKICQNYKDEGMIAIHDNGTNTIQHYIKININRNYNEKNKKFV